MTAAHGAGPVYRASYLVGAARRLRGVTGLDELTALARERRFFAQHHNAQQTREQGALRLDAASAAYGPLLGWYSQRDERVTPECRAADRRNFDPTRPPRIGLPGVGPHVGCVTADTVVTSPRVRAATSRWYTGELVEITTANGNHLAITPNHPVLTEYGWIPAGQLDLGSYVVGARLGESPAVAVDPDHHQQPTLIADVARALLDGGGVMTPGVPVATEDLHGDGRGGQVDVVWAKGVLVDDLDAAQAQPSGVEKLGGVRGDLAMSGDRSAAEFFVRGGAPTGRRMSRLEIARVLLGAAPSRHDPVGVGDRASGDPSAVQDAANAVPTGAVALGKGLLTGASDVSAGNLVGREFGTERGARLVAAGLRQGVGGALVPQGSSLDEGGAQYASPDVEFVGDGVDPAVAALVELDRVVKVVRRTSWRGHVYNLETVGGWYSGNNIIVHNCRCRPGPPIPGAPLVDPTATPTGTVAAAREGSRVAIELAEGVNPRTGKPYRYHHDWVPRGPGIPDRRGPAARKSTQVKAGKAKAPDPQKRQARRVTNAQVTADYRRTKPIPADEVAALERYKRGPSTVNAWLRGQKKLPDGRGVAVSRTQRSDIAKLDRAAQRYSLPGDAVLHRGIGDKTFPTGDLTGKTIQDKALMSTSFDAGFAGPIQMTIHAPKGTHGIPVDGVGGGVSFGEEEFLLPRGTKLKVVSDKKSGGTRHIAAVIVPADHEVTASRRAAAIELAIELAAPKPLPDGQQMYPNGLTYNPKTRSFHPTTDAEKNAAKGAKGGDFNSKHPRAASGSPTGGQFVPVGQARDQQGAAAQKSKQAQADYRALLGASADERAKMLRGLDGPRLEALTRLLYSFKSSAPSLVAARVAAAGELSHRGKKVTDFGALGGTKGPAGKKAAGKAAGKGSLPADRSKWPKKVVLDDSVSDAQVNQLIAAGYKGRPGDGQEALYAPALASDAPAVELSAKTAGYSATHSPLGRPGGPGLWGHKGWQLPAYVQNVAKGIMESGATRSKAIEIAVGKIRDWAQGRGNVSPEVRAASVKAIAEWEALKARAGSVKLSRLADAIELARHVRTEAGVRRYRKPIGALISGGGSDPLIHLVLKHDGRNAILRRNADGSVQRRNPDKTWRPATVQEKRLFGHAVKSHAAHHARIVQTLPPRKADMPKRKPRGADFVKAEQKARAAREAKTPARPAPPAVETPTGNMADVKALSDARLDAELTEARRLLSAVRKNGMPRHSEQYVDAKLKVNVFGAEKQARERRAANAGRDWFAPEPTEQQAIARMAPRQRPAQHKAPVGETPAERNRRLIAEEDAANARRDPNRDRSDAELKAMSRQDLQRLSNALHMTLPAADNTQKARIRAQIERVKAALDRLVRPVSNLAERRLQRSTSHTHTADTPQEIEMAKPMFGGKTPTATDVRNMVAAHAKVPDKLKGHYRKKVIGHARKANALHHVPPAWLKGDTADAPTGKPAPFGGKKAVPFGAKK